jgi:predicted metal-dependent phosphoesterase TrpH
MRGKVDLHLHSTASDGQYSPKELVEMALARHFSAIAITDHDSVEGIDEALEAAQGKPLEVIPGVEISAEDGPREAHVLGYYIDYHHQPLRERLATIKEFRRLRAQRIMQRLAQLGIPLSDEKVAEIAGKTSVVGRPHIAQAMVQEGYVTSTNEAFAQYLGRGAPAYVPHYKLTPVEAVEMILEAKGLPVLAHPLDVLDQVPQLVSHGLVGLEVYYGQYSWEEIEYLNQTAKAYDLIATGGTDFHGLQVLATPDMGEAWIPEECLERLHALKGETRAP